MGEVKSLQKNRIQETFVVAGTLAIVGGFLDAYTYLLRGGVFANAQTGNIVLLGIRFAEGKPREAFYYLLPIVAFALGVLMNAIIKSRDKRKEYSLYEHRILIIEAGLLLIIGFLPLSLPNGIVNITISFICSLQVNSFRLVNKLPYASTMCTGNLRSGVEKVYLFLDTKEKKYARESLYYFGIITLFIIGASLGSILVKLIGVKSIWVCSLILLLVSGTIKLFAKNS